MNDKGWKVATGVLGSLLLVIGVDATTFAATGNSLILGHLNKAGNVTTVERTTSGPALLLKSRAGSPSLAVSSTRMVKRLNADMVDGFQGGALATKTVTYVDSDSTTSRSSGGAWWQFPVPAPGLYRVDINGGLIGDTGSTDTYAFCGLIHINSAQTSVLDYPMLVSAPMSGTSITGWLAGSQVVRITSTGDYKLTCGTSTDASAHNFLIDARRPLQISFTKINSLKNSNGLTAWTPPAP